MIKEADRKSYLAALCRAVPYHLVDRVLESPTEEALSPQSFVGSVLAVDVVNFTARVDALSRLGEAPLQLFIAQLDTLLSRLQLEALFPFEGLVVEFAGDGLNVVFRGDRFVERAAAAAMKVHQVVKSMPVAGRSDADPLLVRCGIATGPVTLTCVGDLSRRVTLCTGETVHRAHRVQPIAPPGQTALDPATKEQLPSVTTTPLRDDISQLDGVSSTLDSKPLVSLGERLDEQIEEKISLLEPFVSAPLAARLRTTPQGWRIEPELRRCVVVFAEVSGLEEAGRPRQEIWALIRSVFRSFQKYDGLVLKVTTTALGHQLMAVFGIHSPSENDAEKALLASLEAMTRFSGFRHEGDELAMKLGVHTGQVLFGAIGSASKHDLTAMGDVVNIAARAMKAAQPMEVVATDDIVDATGTFFTVSSLGAKQFKGKSEEIGLNRIHGSIPGRAHYARRRALRRFTSGRDEMTVKLHDLTDRALAGDGALVGIVGAPGTGKSHLLSEAIDKWIEGGGTALVGRCQYALQATPFGPIRQFFDAFLGVGPNESEAQRSKSLRDRLYAYSLGSNAAELIALLQPVNRPDGINEAMFDFSAPAARERLISTVMQFTARRLEETQVLYVLEDLHFADTLTLEFVKRLSAMPKGRPYLFIATTRPDPVVSEVRKAFESEFVLENLSPEDSVKLSCHELNCTRIDEGLSQFLSRRTQGNPDFLVQVIRFLSDRALISVVDGVAQTASVEALEALVPPTGAQVTLARLDGLTEIERRVLRTASAIGVSFSTRVIEGVEREIPAQTIHGAVDNLEKRELVLSDLSSDEYRFHDEMTRTIAYSIIPEDDRRRVHQRIAQVLQQWTSREDMGAVIAHHLEKAGNLTEALTWFKKMVIRTAQRGLLQESKYLEQRLEKLRKMLG